MSILVIIIIALYFVPSLVAVLRRAKGTSGVVVLNLFLGWTFIGWVVALAWAAAAAPEVPIPSTRVPTLPRRPSWLSRQLDEMGSALSRRR